MKWIVLNLTGGLIWIAGLAFSQGVTVSDTVLPVGDHHFMAGLGFGLVGLLLLLWINVRNAV